MKVVIKGIKDLKKQPKIVANAVNRGLLGVATKTMTRLVINTPADTGRLRGGYRILPYGSFTYKISNNNKYGLYVDQGTRPFYPPVRYLKHWARRKGLNPYAVARSIAKKGIKGQHFVRKTIKEVKDKIQDWFLESFKL